MMPTTEPSPKPRRRSRLALIIALAAVFSGGVGVALRSPREKDPEAVWAKARKAFDERRFDDLESLMSELNALRDPISKDRLLRAQLHMTRERIQEAIDDLERVEDDNPLAAQARMQTGQLELRRNRVRAAEAAFHRAIKIDPKLVRAHSELVYIYGMQLRRPLLHEQLRAMSELTNLTFENVFVWCLTRGSIWEPSEVSVDLRRFAEADPGDRASRLALVESLRQLTRFDEAETWLKPLELSDPDVREARVRLALDKGRDLEAEELLKEGPVNHLGLSLLRGRFALAHQDASNAEKHFRTALEIDDNHRDAIFGLANSLRIQGKNEEAKPWLDLSRKHEELGSLIQRAGSPPSRNDPNLLRDLGAACAAIGRYPEARAWYGLAIKKDPLDMKAQQGLFAAAQAEKSSAKPKP